MVDFNLVFCDGFMPNILNRFGSLRSENRTRMHSPDVGSVFGDGAVSGEFTRASHIQDRFASPGILVAVQLKQPLV